MKVALVDPRDLAIEMGLVKYRVEFFDDARGVARSFDVSDADVEAVLNWARQEQRDSEQCSVSVVYRDGEGLAAINIWPAVDHADVPPLGSRGRF